MKRLFSFNFGSQWKALTVFVFAVNTAVFGQNLVLNPSFESVNTGSLQCSWYTSVAQFNNAINNWTLPTGGSTDIFNTALATTCYCSPFSTNASSPGQQAPRTGNGYVNIVTYGNGGCSPWREYIQGQLSSALVVGTTYEVEMWVSLADKMSVGTNNIGVKFSANPYTQGSNCGYYTTPDLNYTGPIILDKQNWVQILFCYTPTTAGLDNFIIGNFYNDAATATAPASGNTSQNTIRYFVEDVRIEAISPSGGGNPGTNGTLSVCSSSPTVNLFNSLGGTPSTTGTWSGPSTLSGGYLGTFNPSTNAPGTYTYTVTGGTTPCAVGGGSSSATVTVTLAPNSNATITPAGPFCSSQPAVTLSAVDPGGTWSGTGITNATAGTFNPATAGVGTHTITYSIPGPCGDIQTTTITVNPVSNATITPAGPFCLSSGAVNLSAASPGGTWSGAGITNATTGAFNPATAGVGTHTITYSISGSCGDVQSTTITVNPNTNASITPVGSLCDLDPPINLTAANSGGTWSGTGITNTATGTFDPSIAGVGTHTVTYTIAGPCGDIQTTTITVVPGYDATITPVGPFCDNDPPLVLTAVDGGGIWSGTGITNASTGTFNPSTAGVGTHTITYSISGQCGDVQTTSIIVNPTMDATITPVGPVCESASAIQLTAVDGGGTWSGTGITNATAGTFNPATAGVGTHTITYTIPGQCGDTQTTSITVVPQENATITSAGPFCELDAGVQLTAANPGGTWSGTGITDPTNGIFSPSLAGVGLHTITYAIGGLCGDTQTTVINVNALDDPSITPAGPFCMGTPSVTLTAATTLGTWSGAGIIDPVSGVFDPVAAGAGSHVITYNTNDVCPNVGTTTISVLDALSVSALQNATICDGETSSLSASASGGNGNYTYTWADQNGAVVGSGTNITVSPSITTTYIVTVDDGCTIPIAFDVVTITVNPLPSVAFTVDNPISCAPLDVIFTNNSNPQGSNCVWDFGDGTTTATCGPVSHTYTTVGCYDVSLTVSETGCTNSLTQTSMVCVVDDPVANFAFTPQTIDIFDPQIYFDNTSLNATTYSWNFGDGSGSLVENPVHTFPTDGEGEYMICLTALNDYGCESEICKPIIVEEELIFYMPNSFTPDGDAHNQTFKPVFTSGFDPYDFNLLIFNRWGEVIWESHDASVGWDGTYGGEMVQDGTYVWKVEFKVLKNDERMIRTGHVNVLR